MLFERALILIKNSFEDRVVLTSDFGVERKATRPVVPDVVCGKVLVFPVFSDLRGWI